MIVIRGTTPDYILTLTDYDLTSKRVYVTISQRGPQINKTNEDVEIVVDTSGTTTVSTISFALSQQETLGFAEGSAAVQVKIIDSEGHVDGTKSAAIQIDKALLERVITYDDPGSPA